MAIGAGQALPLKDQADPRDALLMCILLDHGLRCGEIAALDISAIDVAAGTLTFYRSKVHKTQTHRLTPDTLRAALAYFKQHTSGSLFGMTTREINRRVGQLGKVVGIEKLSPMTVQRYRMKGMKRKRYTIPMGEVERLRSAYEEIVEGNNSGLAVAA